MNFKRKLTTNEEALIKFLINQAKLDVAENWQDAVRVSPMDDGGMGSLKIYTNDLTEERIYRRTVAEYQFKDIDGVDVVASLNLDKNNELFELDIWKVDFSPILSLPDFNNLHE